MSRAWTGISSWCIPRNMLAPTVPVLGVTQVGLKKVPCKTPTTAWPRVYLPLFVSLLLAAQMDSPAHETACTTVQQKAEKAHWWDVSQMLVLLLSSQLQVASPQVKSVICNLCLELPTTFPKFIQPHVFQARSLQPCLRRNSDFFFFLGFPFYTDKMHSCHCFTENP